MTCIPIQGMGNSYTIKSMCEISASDKAFFFFFFLNVIWIFFQLLERCFDFGLVCNIFFFLLNYHISSDDILYNSCSLP